MLTRKTVLLAKIETEYGTDPVPTPSANALLIRNLSVKNSGEVLDRDYLRSSLSPLEFGRGMKQVQVTFETEMKGTGTAGSTPSCGWEGDLLKACGMAEEVSSGSYVKYSPVSSAFPSVTLYVYVDSLFRKIVGCRGTWTLKCEVGKYGFFHWDFRGLYSSPTDGSPETPSFSTVKPPVCLNTSLSVGGYSPVAGKIEIAMNNKIAQRRSINTAGGILEHIVTGRSPAGSFDPEATVEATHPFWSNWESAGSLSLNLGPIGSAAGNKITVTASKMQYQDIKDSDREGIFTYEIPFRLAGSAGDDEITIKFE